MPITGYHVNVKHNIACFIEAYIFVLYIFNIFYKHAGTYTYIMSIEIWMKRITSKEWFTRGKEVHRVSKGGKEALIPSGFSS